MPLNISESKEDEIIMSARTISRIHAHQETFSIE